MNYEFEMTLHSALITNSIAFIKLLLQLFHISLVDFTKKAIRID